MDGKTAKIAEGGVFSALAMLFLAAACILPSGRLTFVALAGVVGAVLLVRCGWQICVMSWMAVSVLSLLLLPSKGCAILYAVFFGPYTLVKNAIERLRRRSAEWIFKYLFCIAETVLLFCFSKDVLGLFPAVIASRLWLFLPVVAIAFLAYDIVFSKLISLLLYRIPRR
jgi:hypothetical protein